MTLKKICRAEQMRAIDAAAMKNGAIPGIILMENAAIACVKHLGGVSGKRVLIFCGSGNNGGDGLAIARHLIQKGADTEVILTSEREFSGDALINYNILVNMQAKIIKFKEIQDIYSYIKCADVVVDAIYGTGVRGEITGEPYNAIEAINKYSPFTLSVDIPSGLSTNCGEICGICVKADITVTFAAYKLGMFLYPGADFTGKIFMEDISVPENIICAQNINVNLCDTDLLKSLCPKRKADSHKGDYGKILIAGGSPGMTGAVVLSAQAALFSGGGLITAAVPKPLNQFMENKLTEVMSVALKDTNGFISSAGTDDIIEKANQSDAFLFGVGLGRNAYNSDILEKIISQCRTTLIIDADGLFALSKNVDMLKKKSCDIILTPHSAEFARLIGKTTAETEKNRIELSLEFAEKYGVTLVLKGSRTIITSSGEQYINISGNAGMASGGSGDVLAGMITAFAARKMTPLNAAVFGVGLHGLAGDAAMKNVGIESVTAGGIIRHIPSAFEILCN